MPQACCKFLLVILPITHKMLVSRTSASKIFIGFLIKYIAIILLLSTCISVLSVIEVANLH